MLVKGRFWTVSNMLSLSRLVLLPLFFWALLTPNYRWLAIALVGYGIVSDLLDGYLARLWQQSSDWGRILDPFADKVVVASALLFCFAQRGLPGWMLALALGRDLLILGLAPFVYVRTRSFPGSLLFGRLAALSLGLLAVAYLFEIIWAQVPLLAVTTLLQFLSAWQYAKRLSIHAP